MSILKRGTHDFGMIKIRGVKGGPLIQNRTFDVGTKKIFFRVEGRASSTRSY